MLMDHTMLPYTQSTISCCTQSPTSNVITRQQALVNAESIFSTQINSYQLLAHMYSHSETQTPLVRFVIDILYHQFRNKSTKN